jgi:restriction system protein
MASVELPQDACRGDRMVSPLGFEPRANPTPRPKPKFPPHPRTLPRKQAEGPRDAPERAASLHAEPTVSDTRQMMKNRRAPAGLPTYEQVIGATVQALRRLGGSANIDELNEKLIELMKIPEDVSSYRRDGANMNEVAYRGAWARTHLRKDGVVERTARGVWALTPRGRSISDKELSGVLKRIRKQPTSNKNSDDEPLVLERIFEAEDAWKIELLTILRGMAPDAFERLAQKLLRESGFNKIEVTGRSGDGGIDGIGVLRIQLVSFQVLFQCKRYKDTVGPGAIRDFRGAMVGRTDKDLLITTGRFSSEARREATRDGAPAIELIDGEELCDLLRQFSIGVSIETVERVIVKPETFNSI